MRLIKIKSRLQIPVYRWCIQQQDTGKGLRMFERIQAMFVKWHELKEISALTPTDLADLGMSREQVEFFVRMPLDVPTRMAQMAGVFGLTEDQLKADYSGYMELLEVCGHCGARKACSKVLDHAKSAVRSEADFCPNASTYAQMSPVV